MSGLSLPERDEAPDTVTLSRAHGQALIDLLSRSNVTADAAEQEAILALSVELAFCGNCMRCAKPFGDCCNVCFLCHRLICAGCSWVELFNGEPEPVCHACKGGGR